MCKNWGIPTTYNHINFRSRLEARWAAFFDLLEWKWEYEPIDLDNYIPDFVLIGAVEQFFVEVKPVFAFPEDVAKRLEALGIDNRFLIVGATLFKGCSLNLKLGFFYHETKFWSEAVFIRDRYTKKYGFVEPLGGWDNRITGEYKGDDFDWIYYGDRDILKMWREAGNTVQWKKR